MDSCFVCLFCHSVNCHGPPTTLRYHSVLVSKLTYYHRSHHICKTHPHTQKKNASSIKNYPVLCSFLVSGTVFLETNSFIHRGKKRLALQKDVFQNALAEQERKNQKPPLKRRLEKSCRFFVLPRFLYDSTFVTFLACLPTFRSSNGC